MHTASAAFLDALQEAGDSCVFANFGSDHPAPIEAIAAARAAGRPAPAIVACPNKMVAQRGARPRATRRPRPGAAGRGRGGDWTRHSGGARGETLRGGRRAARQRLTARGHPRRIAAWRWLRRLLAMRGMHHA